MSIRDILLVAVAALIGGAIAAYALDIFPTVKPPAQTASNIDLTQFTKFAPDKYDSTDTLRDKMGNCWGAIWKQFPEIGKRIPDKNYSGSLMLDSSYPSEQEIDKLKLLVTILPICRYNTKVYYYYATPVAAQSMVTALDRVFFNKDVVYKALVDGSLTWGQFAQQLREIDLAYSKLEDETYADLNRPAMSCFTNGVDITCR